MQESGTRFFAYAYGSCAKTKERQQRALRPGPTSTSGIQRSCDEKSKKMGVVREDEVPRPKMLVTTNYCYCYYYYYYCRFY